MKKLISLLLCLCTFAFTAGVAYGQDITDGPEYVPKIVKAQILNYENKSVVWIAPCNPMYIIYLAAETVSTKHVFFNDLTKTFAMVPVRYGIANSKVNRRAPSRVV